MEKSGFNIFNLLFQGFTSPPPREALLELARAKNATQLPLIQVQCIATDCSNPYLAKDSHNSFSSQKLALGYRLIVIASPPPIINSRPGISRRSGKNLISSSNLRHRPSGFDYGGGGGGGLKPQYNRSKPGD